MSRSLALSACNLLFNPDVKSSSRQDLLVVCHHCHCKRQLATRWHLDDEVRVPLWGHTLWTWIVSGCYKGQKNVVHWLIILQKRMDLLSIWPDWEVFLTGFPGNWLLLADLAKRLALLDKDMDDLSCPVFLINFQTSRKWEWLRKLSLASVRPMWKNVTNVTTEIWRMPMLTVTSFPGNHRGNFLTPTGGNLL